MKVHQSKNTSPLISSERVLGERAAHRGVRALRDDGQLLAEGRERHLDLKGAEDQEGRSGVALQAAAEIRPRPGGLYVTPKQLMVVSADYAFSCSVVRDLPSQRVFTALQWLFLCQLHASNIETRGLIYKALRSIGVGRLLT